MEKLVKPIDPCQGCVAYSPECNNIEKQCFMKDSYDKEMQAYLEQQKKKEREDMQKQVESMMPSDEDIIKRFNEEERAAKKYAEMSEKALRKAMITNIASAALQGILSNIETFRSYGMNSRAEFIEESVMYALATMKRIDEICD